MQADITAISVAVITAIIGPIVVYYFTSRKFGAEIEKQKDNNQLIQLQRRSQNDENISEMGIKITSIHDDEKVDRFFTVKGTFKKRPNKYHLQLFVIAPKGEAGFWPQGIAIFDDSEKTWRADVHVGGTSGSMAIILASLVGPEGQALCKYYKKIGDQLQQWPSIDVLTSDIIEAHRVRVIRK